MIGSLLYLMVSRLDIMFSVCLCVQFQVNLKESHLDSVKRIIKYLRGTTNIELLYPEGIICDLVGYSYLDYIGCTTDCKSTGGACHILGNALVSWSCKKKSMFALSVTKS